jgi:hypothetical protein
MSFMRNSGNAVVQLMASRDSSSRFFLKMAGLCHSDERERGLFPELLFDCYYLCERLSTAIDVHSSRTPESLLTAGIFEYVSQLYITGYETACDALWCYVFLTVNSTVYLSQFVNSHLSDCVVPVLCPHLTYV